MGNAEKLLEMLASSVSNVIDTRFAIIDVVKAMREVQVTPTMKLRIALMAMKRAGTTQRAMIAAIEAAESKDYASGEDTVWGAVNLLTGVATHAGFVHGASIAINDAANLLTDNYDALIRESDSPVVTDMIEQLILKRNIIKARKEKQEMVE
jgi:hypothetical protein